MTQKIFIAADHGGYELKQALLREFSDRIEWVDLGTHSGESVDYPDFAKTLAEELKKKFSPAELQRPCGILICGSGVGISIKANRYPWVRAALVCDVEVAKLSRQHNAANVLCLGGRFTPLAKAKDIVQAWLDTDFEGGRHERRVQKLD